MNKLLQAKLKKIRLLALDIDGILTDSRVLWIESQGWSRMFSLRDGYGTKALMENGIPVAFLSGSKTADIEKRVEHLKIPYAYLGNEDKLTSLERLEKDSGIPRDRIAYMGDDVFDLPVLRAVGFSASVPECVALVRKEVDYLTKIPGGLGAAREVMDMILEAQRLGPYAAARRKR